MTRSQHTATIVVGLDRNDPHDGAVLGHADWWKLNALLYILRHPAPAYPAGRPRSGPQPTHRQAPALTPGR